MEGTFRRSGPTENGSLPCSGHKCATLLTTVGISCLFLFLKFFFKKRRKTTSRPHIERLIKLNLQHVLHSQQGGQSPSSYSYSYSYSNIQTCTCCLGCSTGYQNQLFFVLFLWLSEKLSTALMTLMSEMTGVSVVAVMTFNRAWVLAILHTAWSWTSRSMVASS